MSDLVESVQGFYIGGKIAFCAKPYRASQSKKSDIRVIVGGRRPFRQTWSGKLATLLPMSCCRTPPR